jgi:hypothetical protein
MKKTLWLVAALFIFSLHPSPASADSENTTPTDWAMEAVAFLETNQLAPEELFSNYNSAIRRDEFSAMMIGIYDLACQNNYSFVGYPDPFSDTIANRYSLEIKKAHRMGLIAGTSSNTFSPFSNITREDVAVLISRFIKQVYLQEEIPFSKRIADISSISEYALASVEYCLSHQVMNGTGDDMFSPKGLLTRQEAMAIMYNICVRYQIVEKSVESAISKLTPVNRRGSVMERDGYLYICQDKYPFRFNGEIIQLQETSLLRIPLDQSRQNEGEVLLVGEYGVAAYFIIDDRLYFCDSSPERKVYSADKDCKNIKVINSLSRYSSSFFYYMHVEGDWLFLSMGDEFFKMRTDGTCLSIIYRGMGGIDLFTEGDYFHFYKHIFSNDSDLALDGMIFGRVSFTGDRSQVYYRHTGFVRSWHWAAFGEVAYVALYIDNTPTVPPSPIPSVRNTIGFTGIPLVEIKPATGEARTIHTFAEDEQFIVNREGVFISSVNRNQVTWKNISGGQDISFILPYGDAVPYQKYGDYLYSLEIGYPNYTRYHLLYNIKTGLLTDITGNPAD